MGGEADPFDLKRFLEAQARVIDAVRAELRAGRKRGHWMWFIFPQIAGLGFSPMAQFYALRSRAEAEAYLQHPVLGARLRECAQLVCGIEGRSIREIFGAPDDLKFRSSMTLFAAAAPGEAIFAAALTKFYGGAPDRLTIEKLSSVSE